MKSKLCAGRTRWTWWLLCSQRMERRRYSFPPKVCKPINSIGTSVPPNAPSNMQMVVLELDDMRFHSKRDAIDEKRDELSQTSSDLEKWLSHSYPNLSYTAFSPIPRPNSDSPKRTSKKSVSFSTVEIREYKSPERADPQCEQGLSLSLDRLTTSIQKFDVW